MPKYSIVLPTYNSSKYLKAAMDSVLSNDYKDFEFIVSNNCSDDDTEQIVKSYTDPRLKYISPVYLETYTRLVLKHVTGDWVIGIGTDDALCPFFFKLADKLTELADKNAINVIKTNRACFYWSGLEHLYGDTYAIFNASNEIEVKEMSETFKSGFYTSFGYFDIPQMYVSSMFRKDVLKNAQKYNINNNIIEPNAIFPHDAYLSCLVACLESRYLYCNIPFAWVGSSSASVGLKERLGISSKKTTDNSYSKLHCLEYLLYECLNKFLETYKGSVPNYIREILQDKDSLFVAILKNNYFSGHNFYYRDFNELSNKRYSYFLEYLDKENVDPEKIFKAFKNSIDTRSKSSLTYKELITLLIAKVKKRLFKKRNKVKSFSFDIKKPVLYSEVNNILAGSDEINSIIESI